MHTINLPNGLTVWGLSQADTMIVYKEIFEEQVYRMHGLEIKPGDCIFDIGANTGLFAVYLSKTCPGVRFFGFEPIPWIYDVLERNVKDHPGIDAKLFKVGMSRRSGEATFTYYPRMSCGSTMYPDNSAEETNRACDYVLTEIRKMPKIVAWPVAILPRPLKRFLALRVHRFYRKEETITCPLRTVSGMIRELALDRIDLLKVDAERAELDILAGIEDQDWPRIRQAVVEVHEEKDLPSAETALKDRGFRVVVERHSVFTNISMLYATRV